MRNCPPDRCSGQAPDATKYELVDQKIRALFVLGMRRYALENIDIYRTKIQAEIFTRLTPLLTSLEYTIGPKRDRLMVDMAEACRGSADVLGDLSVACGVNNQIRAVVESLVSQSFLISILSYFNSFLFRRTEN